MLEQHIKEKEYLQEVLFQHVGLTGRDLEVEHNRELKPIKPRGEAFHIRRAKAEARQRAVARNKDNVAEMQELTEAEEIFQKELNNASKVS